MANVQRTARIADQIQRELAELIRLELKDPRVGMLTLTGVDVSSDLAHAKVYFSTLTETGREETLLGLKRASGFLRSMLGKRLRTHMVPELHFQFDASVARGIELSQLIDRAVADSSSDEPHSPGSPDLPAEAGTTPAGKP
jgi:ribosome-binding factor A